MKIKINNAAALGLHPDRTGEVHECTKVGEFYRPVGRLHWLRVSDAALAAKYAELVDAPVGTLAGGLVPMQQQYNPPTPSGRQIATEMLAFTGGMADGIRLYMTLAPLIGDDIVVSHSGRAYNYIISHFDVSMLMWVAVPKP